VTLIEILTGAIILALVLIPSLYVLISNTSTISSTRDHVMAAFWAQRILEIARTYPFDKLDMDQFPVGDVRRKDTLEYDMIADDATKDRIPLGEQINHIKYFLEDVKVGYVKTKSDPAANAKLCLISFTVKYTGLDQRTHKFDVHTAVGGY
jgi:hypothetical protein